MTVELSGAPRVVERVEATTDLADVAGAAR